MTDCIQCREWELCPFHPKEKPARLPDPLDIVLLGPELWNESFQQPPTTKGMTVRSACGHYWQTWRDGKLVDEEPYEPYGPADVSDDTADAIMYGLIGVAPMHTDGLKLLRSATGEYAMGPIVGYYGFTSRKPAPRRSSGT